MRPSVAVTVQRPRRTSLVWSYCRRRLFANPANSAVTLVMLTLLAAAAYRLLHWAIWDSIWWKADPETCRAAAGACWSLLWARGHLMLFGLYPAEEHWRPAAAICVFLLALCLSFFRSLWTSRRVVALWFFAATGFVALLSGGLPGMPSVPSDQWGGLPVTIYVFVASTVLGLPLGILLAVGRRSTYRLVSLPIIVLIEVLRATPLVCLLFFAAVVLPGMLPALLDPGKLHRVIVILALFLACYQAEIIRGGLQAIPPGQVEASKALGLRPVLIWILIMLPQAIRATVLPTANLLIVHLKDTALVVIVGIFDLVTAVNAAVRDGPWSDFLDEAYLVMAAIFGLLVLALSSLSGRLHRHLANDRGGV